MWTDELCFNVVFVMWTMVVGSEVQYIIEDEFTHKNHVQAFWGRIRPQNLRMDWPQKADFHIEMVTLGVATYTRPQHLNC